MGTVNSHPGSDGPRGIWSLTCEPVTQNVNYLHLRLHKYVHTHTHATAVMNGTGPNSSQRSRDCRNHPFAGDATQPRCQAVCECKCTCTSNSWTRVCAFTRCLHTNSLPVPGPIARPTVPTMLFAPTTQIHAHLTHCSRCSTRQYPCG